jgi:hypothetical protein
VIKRCSPQEKKSGYCRRSEGERERVQEGKEKIERKRVKRRGIERE